MKKISENVLDSQDSCCPHVLSFVKMRTYATYNPSTRLKDDSDDSLRS